VVPAHPDRSFRPIVIACSDRHRRFFSVAELNAAIWELLPALNARPMRKLGVSRRELFEQLDRRCC
jgi:hypothetical protein